MKIKSGAKVFIVDNNISERNQRTGRGSDKINCHPVYGDVGQIIREKQHEKKIAHSDKSQL